MSRPDRDEFWFRIAAEYATMATCPRASIGCVIVNPTTKRQIGAGYNGAETGAAHCVDVGCLMIPGADHCLRAVHAEINAAQQVAVGSRNLVAYVVGGRDVCSHCARELYAVGVREIKARPAFRLLDHVVAEVVAWQAVTFPRATPKSVAEHLRREAIELSQDPEDTGELADVVFLAVGLAYELGADLANVVHDKLVINRRRTWGQPDDHGVVEHIRDGVPA